ncbi:MAG: gamma carbonic anhydrase family protein [Spirochaetaceae bacterium]|mgnify:CR=1 FL=1|nr:gamma carbonic anhydrase family protein [Spirochaetaceae bacterium]
MAIYKYQDKTPELGTPCFVAEDARVIGDVRIGNGSSVWWGSTIRGDVHHIRIGEYTNIQDMCMIHVTGGKFPTVIGNHCTLGHNVTIHGAFLHDHAFVGIGSTVMDGCEIEPFGFLAAGSMLTPGKKIPSGMLFMGSPARPVREITDQEREMILKTAEKYHHLSLQYADPTIVSRVQ